MSYEENRIRLGAMIRHQRRYSQGFGIIASGYRLDLELLTNLDALWTACRRTASGGGAEVVEAMAEALKKLDE